MTVFYFDMRRIGQTIARLRRKQNLTQMALADLMGVSFQAVSNWGAASRCLTCPSCRSWRTFSA